MKGITFLCCVNDERQLNSLLLPSLDKLSLEGLEYNTIFIDAQECHYHSAAEAYNTEAKKNEDHLKEILVFLHQDIAFDDGRLFLTIIRELASDPNQIIGVAGMPTSGKTISNLKYKESGCYITSTQVSEKTEVCSVDECCFALTRDLFLRLLFNERICDGWHLYAAELCYHAMAQCNIPSYVLPDSIYHKKNGSAGLFTDSSYLMTMWKIAREYKNNVASIYSPCYIVSTSFVPCLLKIGRTFLKNLISL